MKTNFLRPNSSAAATVGAIAAAFTQTHTRSRPRSWAARVTGDLLMKDEILREEHGAGAENGTQCAHGGLEYFDEDRGEDRTTW